MKRQAPKANWCFTGWKDLTIDPNDLFKPETMIYLIVGNETCPDTRRPHYQCYVQYKRKVRFNQVKDDFGKKIHCEASKGNDEQNYDYCSKEGDFKEHGARKNTKGSRTDLTSAMAAAEDMPLSELMEHPEHSIVVSRCMPFFRQLYANRTAAKGRAAVADSMAGVELREWQSRLVDIVSEAPCPRKVYWIWDESGNSGKSFMAKYLMARHDAAIFTNGKLADLAFAYTGEPVVVIDLARTSVEHLDHWYTFIESLKNGILFSPKYESGSKIFKPPHVVVFANFIPDTMTRYTKLSADRWMEINIEGQTN